MLEASRQGKPPITQSNIMQCPCQNLTPFSARNTSIEFGRDRYEEWPDVSNQGGTPILPDDSFESENAFHHAQASLFKHIDIQVVNTSLSPHHSPSLSPCSPSPCSRHSPSPSSSCRSCRSPHSKHLSPSRRSPSLPSSRHSPSMVAGTPLLTMKEIELYLKAHFRDGTCFIVQKQ